MPRVCTICRHDQRPALDRALAAGGSPRALGAEYGVSPDALKRHRAHVPVPVVQRQALAEAQAGLDIARQLAAINRVALAILQDARQAGRPDVALRAIDRVQRQLEFQRKLIETEELEERIAALEAHTAPGPQAQAHTHTGGHTWG